MTASAEEHTLRECAFGPLRIAFDDRVLEPRAWTVMQSEWAAELAPELPPGPILELFAGAGHIGLLASVLTDRPLVQVEADAVAADFAARNGARAGIADRVEVRCARVDDALDQEERFTLIVADPPYLPSAEIGRFPADPVRAIDGGNDGLVLVRATLDVLTIHMTSGGNCLLQLAGPGQVESTRRLVDDGWPVLTVAASRSIDTERAVALVTRR